MKYLYCMYRFKFTCELIPTPVDELEVLAKTSHAEGGKLEIPN